MRFSTQVKPISYVKANMAEVIERLHETVDPLIITQRGEAKAVLMDIRAYEEMEDTRKNLIARISERTADVEEDAD